MHQIRKKKLDINKLLLKRLFFIRTFNNQYDSLVLPHVHINEGNAYYFYEGIGYISRLLIISKQYPPL